MPVIRHTCPDSPVVGDVVASGLFGACIRPEEKAQPEQDYAYA
ncbi:unknown [Prevotella sp. CAG:755]|nr:unknown [Prevotella sp. CAG:755]